MANGSLIASMSPPSEPIAISATIEPTTVGACSDTLTVMARDIVGAGSPCSLHLTLCFVCKVMCDCQSYVNDAYIIRFFLAMHKYYHVLCEE